MEDDEFTRPIEAVVGLARAAVQNELASLCAAALGDPDVDEAAKSLAGFWLQRVGEDVKGG